MNQPLDGFKASRKEAIAANDKFFYTGVPCKRGHLAKRRVDNSSCMECGRENTRKRYEENIDRERAKARERKARNYKENPEPFKLAEKKRRESKPEYFKQVARTYYETHREERIAAVKAYQEANQEIIKEQRKNQYAVLSQAEKITRSEARRLRWIKNPEAKKEAYEKAKQYREVNRERVRAGRVNREAAIRAAKGSITEKEISFLLNFQNNLCFYCENPLKEYHVDHFIAISKGGDNNIENIVIACPTCNLRKQARHPLVFLGLIMEEKKNQ